MSGADRTQQFEAAVLPHLDAAYNLARWLLRDEQSAQDVVQESYLRAFRFFDGFRGGDARPWLLGIVRNSCFTWLRENVRDHVEFDEERDSEQCSPALHEGADGPERLFERKLEHAKVNKAIATLPPLFREVLVLREIEALSYEEIAQVASIPAGTVMSRLSRARSMLRTALVAADKED